MIITVRAARVNAGVSQEDIAAALSLSLMAYRRKESGKTRFYADEIAVLSNLLNVEIANFFEIQCLKKTRKGGKAG